MDTARPRGIAKELLGVWLAAVVFYRLTLSRSFAETHDSIENVNCMDAGWHSAGMWYHPHHLLFAWLGGHWNRFWQLLGVTTDTEILARLMNASVAGVALCAFYALLRLRAGVDRRTAVAATILPAVSFGFWNYSMGIEPPILPLALMLVSVFLLTSPCACARTYLWVGLLHGFAALCYEPSGLFGVVVITSLALRQQEKLGARLRQFALYLAVSAPLVILPYLYAMFAFEHRTGALRWLTFYAGNKNYWTGPSLGGVAKIVIGSLRSLIGGQFLFNIPDIEPLLRQLLRGKWLVHSAFVTRDVPPAVAWLLLLGAGVFGLLLVVTVALRLRHWRAAWQRHRMLLGCLLAWLISYCLFFSFYEPMNVKFWVPQATLFWLILAILWGSSAATDAGASRRYILLPALAGLLAAINFAGAFYWMMDVRHDYYRAIAKPLIESSRPGDLIIIGRPWILEEYLRRYAPGRDVVVLSNAFEAAGGDAGKAEVAVNAAIAKAGDRFCRVVISGEAVQLEQESVVAFGPAFLDFTKALWTPWRTKLDESPGTPMSTYLLREEHPIIRAPATGVPLPRVLDESPGTLDAVPSSAAPVAR